jgi:hypothetical protein
MQHLQKTGGGGHAIAPWSCLHTGTLPRLISFVCHSYENCRVCTPNSHSGTGAFRRSDVQTFRCAVCAPDAFVGRSASPIAANRLWCHNPQWHANSSPSGETTPLPPVSKTRRADIGNRSTTFPITPRLGRGRRLRFSRSRKSCLGPTFYIWTDQQGAPHYLIQYGCW